MGVITTYYSANITKKMESTDVYPNLTEEKYAEMLALLPYTSDYLILKVQDQYSYEIMYAKNINGTITLERGKEGTTAALHMYNACMSSVATPALMSVVRAVLTEAGVRLSNNA